MPIMRNWFDFAAIHRDNIRDVRIQFCEDAKQADHNSLYKHKIGQPVVLGICQSDKDISHFVDATVIGVRFSSFVSYDIAIPVGNSGVMSVMKMIPSSSLRHPDRVYDEEEIVDPEEVKQPTTRLTVVEQNSEAEELAPCPKEIRWPKTFFGEQITDMRPTQHSIMITSLMISGAMEFEYNNFQIGDAIKIDNGDEPAFYGYIYAINVSQHFSYDIACPTRDGYYAIYRDINAEYLTLVNSIPV